LVRFGQRCSGDGDVGAVHGTELSPMP
jgi:hypothetical protein